MKIAIWGVFAFVALLWTGGAALFAQLVQWSAQGLAASGSASLGGVLAAVSPPSWLSPWIDPASWAAALAAVGSALSGVAGVVPAIGHAVAWLVPTVWVIWGVGLLALVVLTLFTAWLLGRLGHGEAPGPQSA